MQDTVIAAVKNNEEFELALQSDIHIIFELIPNITSVAGNARKARAMGKKLYVHLDLAEGIGKDKYGIAFLKDSNIDGIISTRANIIKAAKAVNLKTVQRFFIVDSKSIETAMDSISSAKPDMIELMPGIATKIIEKLKLKTNTPIIAGGLIETKDEVYSALKAGAKAISTGKQLLWSEKYE